MEGTCQPTPKRNSRYVQLHGDQSSTEDPRLQIESERAVEEELQGWFLGAAAEGISRDETKSDRLGPNASWELIREQFPAKTWDWRPQELIPSNGSPLFFSTPSLNMLPCKLEGKIWRASMLPNELVGYLSWNLRLMKTSDNLQNFNRPILRNGQSTIWANRAHQLVDRGS